MIDTCTKCGTALVRLKWNKASKGDTDASTDTKVYRVDSFGCGNKACAAYGEAVRTTSTCIFDASGAEDATESKLVFGEGVNAKA